VGVEGKVIAIEPDAVKCSYLSERFHRLGYRNIILLRAALWDRNGVEVFRSTGDEGASLFSTGEGIKGYRVQTRTLDSIATDLGLDGIDYIKMDIEGAELEAIEGAREVLEKSCPDLVIAAYHLRYGAPTYRILTQRLTVLGYSIRVGFSRHLTLYGEKNKSPR
jgi:FkbM family methyltransferase